MASPRSILLVSNIDLLLSVLQLWNLYGLLNPQEFCLCVNSGISTTSSMNNGRVSHLVQLTSLFKALCLSRSLTCPTGLPACYLVRVDGLTADSLRFFCCAQVLAVMLGFLVSSLGQFSCLTSCRSALLLSSHCPPSNACLCVTAGSRCDCSSRFNELFAHPRADPRVLLVVLTFFSWSAGCVTSLHVLRVVRWLRPQPALSPPLHAARGVVAFFGAMAL